jgi:hypothetical protein
MSFRQDFVLSLHRTAGEAVRFAEERRGFAQARVRHLLRTAPPAKLAEGFAQAWAKPWRSNPLCTALRSATLCSALRIAGGAKQSFAVQRGAELCGGPLGVRGQSPLRSKKPLPFASALRCGAIRFAVQSELRSREQKNQAVQKKSGCSKQCRVKKSTSLRT